MDVKITVAMREKLAKLCKKYEIAATESWGARDYFMALLENPSVPHYAKYEALEYYDKWVVAVFN